jgi:hypothetical protein
MSVGTYIRARFAQREHDVSGDDLLFVLTPQRDRRQQPDRRLVWRGSRRAADYARAKATSVNESPVFWPSLLDHASLVMEKPLLHRTKLT